VPVLFSLVSIWCLATNRLLELPHTWIEAVMAPLRRLARLPGRVTGPTGEA